MSRDAIRHGVLVGAGVGVLGCAREWCKSFGFKAAPLGRLELGYRHGFVAGVVSLAGGGIRVRPPGGDYGSPKVTVFDLDFGLLLFPVLRTRVDPYFGLALGWNRVRGKDVSYLGGSLGETLNRGALRVTGGLNVYVSRIVSLGARFDLHSPFAGKSCLDTSASLVIDGPNCYAIRDLEEDFGVDSSELPLPWAVTIDLRVIIPVPGSG